MKIRKKIKHKGTYRLEEFENFKSFGLEGTAPKQLIDKASKFLREELSEEKYGLRLATKELDFIANEMSRMAIAIQAFAINCSKITPLNRAPINISHGYPEIKFKQNVFVNTDFNTIIKAKDKYLDLVYKLYHLNEIDPTLVKKITVKIELNKSVEIEIERLDLQEDINNLLYLKNKRKLSTEEKTTLSQNQNKLTATPDPKKVKKLNEEFTIPSQMHNETISILTYLIENLTAYIDLYSDLNARKDRAEKAVYNLSIDAILPYLRKYIYPTDKIYDDIKYDKQEAPKTEEFLIIALILVTAGILPTEEEYPYSKLKRKNGTRPVQKRYFDRILKEETKQIKRNRSYSTRMIEIVEDSYKKANKDKKDKGKEEYPYYQGYTGYYNLKKITTPFNQKLQRTLP